MGKFDEGAATGALVNLRDILRRGYTLNDDQRRILYDVVSLTLGQAVGDGEGPERAWEALISALHAETRSLKSDVVEATGMARLARLTSFTGRVRAGERTDELYDQIKGELWG